MSRPIVRILHSSLQIFLLMTCSATLFAGVDGDWSLVFLTEAGDRPISITLKSDGENVTGIVMNQEMKGTFRDGKLSMKLPEFYSDDAGFKAELAFEGAVSGNSISGTWRFGEYTGAMKGTLAAGATARGLWNFLLMTEAGDKPIQVSVSIDGESASGRTADQLWAGTFKDGVLQLTAKDFYSPDAGFKADLSLTGKVTGKELAGSWVFAEYNGPLKGTRSE